MTERRRLSILGHTRIVLAVVALAFAAVATVAVAQQGPWSQLGDAYRPVAGDEDAVAHVDGRSISRGELRIGVALLQFNNSVSPRKVSTDRRAALEQIIQVRALAAEAARRGHTPSDAEVSSYIGQVRAAFTPGGAARQRLGEFLSGIGQTEDAFFASSFARSHYAEAAAIGRLRVSIVTGLAPDAASATWDAFITSTHRAAKVEIVDPSLR